MPFHSFLSTFIKDSPEIISLGLNIIDFSKDFLLYTSIESESANGNYMVNVGNYFMGIYIENLIWTRRFITAAIVQGAIIVGLTVFIILGEISIIKPGISRVIASGGAGTWFTFGYIMYTQPHKFTDRFLANHYLYLII